MKQHEINVCEKKLYSGTHGGVLHGNLWTSPGSGALRMPLTNPFTLTQFLAGQCVSLTIRAKQVKNNPCCPLKQTNKKSNCLTFLNLYASFLP